MQPLSSTIKRRANLFGHRGHVRPNLEYVFNRLHGTLLQRNTIPVKRRIISPVTGNVFQLTLGGVKTPPLKHRPPGTPGRKPGGIPAPRSAFNLELAARIARAREQYGARLGHQVTQEEMARRLSQAAGYKITADKYRKYEGGPKPTPMPHDLLFHFAEITGVSTGVLLAPLPFAARVSRVA
jgi:hypothetical protein